MCSQISCMASLSGHGIFFDTSWDTISNPTQSSHTSFSTNETTTLLPLLLRFILVRTYLAWRLLLLLPLSLLCYCDFFLCGVRFLLALSLSCALSGWIWIQGTCCFSGSYVFLLVVCFRRWQEGRREAHFCKV